MQHTTPLPGQFPAPPAALPPTVEEVDAIAALDDPVLRNLRITQAYHELSAAVARRVSPGANWCAFAAWASRQAGQTIRGEDLARAVDDVFHAPEVRERLERVARLAVTELRVELGGTPLDALVARVRRVLDPEAALRRSADAVAAGNLKVFAEIGREFARWLATAARDGPPDAAATAAFCDALRPGEPPEGQRLLREAFAAFGDAGAPHDADARAERLLLANLCVGMQEQTRLQPQIAAALDAAIDADAARGELRALLFPGPWRRLRAALGGWLGRPLPLDAAIDALVAAVQRRLRLVITEHLMTLRLPATAEAVRPEAVRPETVLRLGHDLGDAFPPELRRLDHPPLRAFLARVDPTPDTTGESGATDWADFPERMHYIADFFRCWHARPELYVAPYDAAQVAAIRAGRVPAGPL